MRLYVLVFVFSTAIGGAWAQTSMPTAVDDILASGRMALEDGFSVMAEAAFKSTLKGELSDEDAASARLYLLQSLFAQQKFDEMRSLLDTLLADQLLAGDANAYWRAMIAHGESKYAEAAAVLANFTKLWPESMLGEVALRLQGLSRLKSGNVADAVASFETFSTRFPKSELINLNRLDWGKALTFQDDLLAAIKVLRPVMNDLDAGHLAHEARYWTGKAYLESKEVEKGQYILAPLLDDVDVAAGLRVNVALAMSGAFIELSDDDKAISVLADMLVTVHDEEPKLRLNRALCNVLLTAERLDEVIPLIKAYVSGNPDDASAAGLQLRLGNALLDASRYAEAVPIFQQYLETFANAGDHAEAREGHGWALMGDSRFAEAAMAFEKAYDLYTDSEQKATCLYKMADARFMNGQFQQSLDIYKRLRQAYPTSVHSGSAMLRMGGCLDALGLQTEAVAMFESVVSTYEGLPVAEEALFRIGELQQSGQKPKAAAAAFDRCMELYPKGPYFSRALYGRGMALYQQWSPSAVDDFKLIVSTYPQSAVAEHALFMQALCLYRLGRDDQALVLCNDFLSRFGKSEWAPSVRFWIGKLAYNTERYESAESEFTAFVDQFPEHALAHRALYRAGMASAKRNEYVRAIELYGQLAKSYPSSILLADARFQQADAMCQLGEFAGAILVFDEVINNDPSSELVPLAWGRKGDCQFTLGSDDSSRYEEAIRSYRVVTHSPSARSDTIWQAEYKLGRCLEKLDRQDEALNHYYAKVVVPFLRGKARGDSISESAKVWFTRAAMGAVDIVGVKEDWRQLIRILERIVEADVAVSAEALARIKVIKSEHWWLFY
jgi:TolA-binding protein